MCHMSISWISIYDTEDNFQNLSLFNCRDIGSFKCAHVRISMPNSDGEVSAQFPVFFS